MQVYNVQINPQEPLSLEETKYFLRVQHFAEDELIKGLVTTAREMIENYTNRIFLQQTWRLVCLEQDIPKSRVLILPRAPFIKVVEHPKVFFTGGEATTITDYKAWHHLDYGYFMCHHHLGDNKTLQVDFLVGYGEKREKSPAAMRHALLLIVANLYQHRGDEPEGPTILTDQIRELLQPYRWVALR